MSTSILESAPTSNYFLRSHFVRSIGRPLRSFVRSLARCLGSCALVSIHRMGLMGTLCVGSAEKRAGSIRGTGGPRVLSYTFGGGSCWTIGGIRSVHGEGVQGRGFTALSLSSPLFLLLCSDLLPSRRAELDVYTALHTGVDGIDNVPNTFSFP